MTKQDQQEFKKIIFLLAEYFPRELTSLTLEAYFSALSDLDIEAVRTAASKYSKTGKWFPKPAELRELAIDSHKQITAGDALELVFTKIEKEGFAPEHKVYGQEPLPPLPEIAQKAVKAMGGLRVIAETPKAQHGTLRAQFRDIYNQLAERDDKALMLGEITKEEAKQITGQLKSKIPELKDIG